MAEAATEGFATGPPGIQIATSTTTGLRKARPQLGRGGAENSRQPTAVQPCRQSWSVCMVCANKAAVDEVASQLERAHPERWGPKMAGQGRERGASGQQVGVDERLPADTKLRFHKNRCELILLDEQGLNLEGNIKRTSALCENGFFSVLSVAKQAQARQAHLPAIHIHHPPAMSPSPSGRSRCAAGVERQKKWAPKVRTGCHTCRQRRVKCDERKPECRRCMNLKVDCHYSLVPAARPPVASVLPMAGGLIREPVTSPFPSRLETSGYELEMFSVFRNETVHSLGTFNRDFWATSVPRAAQAYPSLWHACLALAAVQQRVKAPIDEDRPEDASLAISQRHYVFALDQFNRSIACMADRLKKAEPLTYADKQIVLFTNVIYVGLCNILGDTKQAISHLKNITDLIGQFRFGEDTDTKSSSRGILPYPELLAVLAFMDGQSGDFDEIADRFEREFVVSVPSYESFSSVTEAYLAFLVIMFDGLKPLNYADHCTPLGRISLLTGKLEDYKVRLAEFEYRELHKGISKADLKCIAELRLYIRYFDAYFSTWSNTTRTGWIKAEFQFEQLLDDIQQVLLERRQETKMNFKSQNLESRDELLPALRTRAQSFAFCLTPSTLLHEILRVAFTPRARFKAQELMKRYPYQEGALDSDFLVGRYEAFTHFMLRARERTLPAQRHGCPTRRTYSDTAMDPDGPFNGSQDCECLEGAFICRDHRVQYFLIEVINGEEFLRVQSQYDRRYGLEGEVFEYLADVD
ncbi:hypothetical protein NLG97_g4318 [Lecanicillium saksenae]|uniref:Uncharacterized protein n=1 Tax=Lecanicillium saksenae TaxID=468837 RepID=A0ACC1QVM5_9HYPO|nr:hypothetical protein NLG97_g4318 [Lecanicillium saksenae]